MAKTRSKDDVLDFLKSKYGLNNKDNNELSSSDTDALSRNNKFQEDDDEEDDESIEEDQWSAFSDLDEQIIVDETDDDHLSEEFLDEYGYISERLRKTRVIRDGKKKIKWKTNRPGYKVQKDGNRVREIKMTPREQIMRQKQQRIAARSRKRTSRISQTKRKRSMKRRMF